MFTSRLRRRCESTQHWLGVWGVWFFASLGLSCTPQRWSDGAIPDIVAYPGVVEFDGKWLGDVAGEAGELRLERLRPGTLGGNFIGVDPSVQYALVATRAAVSEDGVPGERPGNRLIFEWQDGRSGRGRGWLLISREGDALTGEFGFGDSAIGGGTWSFERAANASSPNRGS